jgi:hypothetical protein
MWVATLSRNWWSCEITTTGPGELLEELLEPADREDVQVVGRLVEQQHVGRAGEHLRQQHAQLEAAGERGERLAVHLGGEPEPLEDRGGARLGGVAVVPLDRLLQLGEAVGVEVLVRAGEQRLLLDHRLPELGVAHQRDARTSSSS